MVMDYPTILLGIGLALIVAVQALRTVFRSETYRKRSKNLTAAVLSFFLPIILAAIFLAHTMESSSIIFFLVLVAIGTCLAIYFLVKAAFQRRR